MNDSSEKRQVSSKNCSVEQLQNWLADSRHKNAVLRDAANEVLAHFMPTFPDSRAVDDCLVGLAAAVAGIESHSHETPACAVVTAAEALLEVLPVPNDYYGEEAQALREALDNTQKAGDQHGS